MGASHPRYGPRKASRWVSKPAAAPEQAKYATWSRRSRYSVLWMITGRASPGDGTSTSPVLKFRWKLVASSPASQRQNSTPANTRRSAAVRRRFATVSCQVSSVAPGGTKNRVSASTPFQAEEMIV